MAKITVSTDLNLELIAKNTGQLDKSKILYRDGVLIVDGVTQAALDAALAAYDHETQFPRTHPSDMDILKDALKTKGIVSDADLNAAKTKLKGA